MIRTVRARRESGLRFAIETGSGHRLAVDDAGGDTAPRPIELILAAQAGCTALDVASILAKKRQVVSDYAVAVTGVQREDPHPHVYTRVDIVHELEGAGLDVEAVRRAIELSATRYCTVTALLSAGPTEVHHRYLVRDGAGAPEQTGEVLVTGPHDDVDAIGAPSAGREPVGTAT